jgi:hypothetical protein
MDGDGRTDSRVDIAENLSLQALRQDNRLIADISGGGILIHEHRFDLGMQPLGQ